MILKKKTSVKASMKPSQYPSSSRMKSINSMLTHLRTFTRVQTPSLYQLERITTHPPYKHNTTRVEIENTSTKNELVHFLHV